MSKSLSDRAVLVVTTDLFFRAKLEELVTGAGRTPRRTGPAALAVVELADHADVERVRQLVAGGTAVVAFGSHVRPALLRGARDAGATAVPNSEIEATVQRALARS